MTNDVRRNEITMEFRWEAPPTIKRAGRRPRNAELEVAAALRDRPDQWLRWLDFEGDEQHKARTLASQIQAGKRAAFRTDGPIEDGEFEARSRKVDDKPNTTAVYIRYASVRDMD